MHKLDFDEVSGYYVCACGKWFGLDSKTDERIENHEKEIGVMIA